MLALKTEIQVSLKKDFTEAELRTAFADCEDLDISISDFYIALIQSSLVAIAYAVTKDNKREIAGLIQVFSDTKWSAVLNYVYVVPKYQKQGVGTTLMNAVMQYLKHINCIYVAPNDMSASGFYEKFGFKVIPEGGLLMT